MLYSKSVTLVTQQDAASIIANIGRVAQNNRGKIVQSSDGVVVVVFGYMLLARLIGVWFMSQFSRFQLPTKLRIEIVEKENKSQVVLNFADNIGYKIRDPCSDAYFQTFFLKVYNEIKQQLSAKDVMMSSEHDGSLGIDGTSASVVGVSGKACTVSGMRKDGSDTFGWSLFGIFLFLPFGLIAAVYTSQARAAKRAGDRHRAVAKGKIAKRWFIATVLAWAVVSLYSLYCDFTGN